MSIINKFFIKNGKSYSSAKIKKTELISSCFWFLDAENNNFLIPKKKLTISDKDSIYFQDLFDKVYINNDCAFIGVGKNFNSEIYIDFNLQKINFVACKDIEEGEEIVCSYHPSCFNNVTIQ
jgi:SET domain-containing protein